MGLKFGNKVEIKIEDSQKLSVGKVIATKYIWQYDLKLKTTKLSRKLPTEGKL